jgi:aerobic-type carbon monoxide dehydrogenase small subunit (CoxS/CutS family)
MTEKEKQKKPVQISRREFLRDAGLLVGGTAIGSTVLLAACGGGETETVTNTVTRTQTATVTSTLPGETQTVTTTVGAQQTATVTQTQTDTLTQTRFVCPECGMEFDTLAELQEHYQATHPTEVVETILTINGEAYGLKIEPHWTLLKVLTEKLGLTGTKLACDRGHCGSCTVIMDGKAVLACTTLATECEGRKIETIEGLADGITHHPIQQAFIDNYGFQCGFCIPGIIMSAKALLDANSNPSEDDIKKALSGNICKCGHYPRIISSVQIAAGGV